MIKGILFLVFSRGFLTRLWGNITNVDLAYIETKPGKMILWRVRLIGIFDILIAIYLLISALTPEFTSNFSIFILMIPVLIGGLLAAAAAFLSGRIQRNHP
jgi:hypothetical protein